MELALASWQEAQFADGVKTPSSFAIRMDRFAHQEFPFSFPALSAKVLPSPNPPNPPTL
jgi:hypothetical protein